MQNSDLAEQLFDEISDEYLTRKRVKEVIRGLPDDPLSAFPSEVRQQMEAECGDSVHDVCVLGSGDNLAAFAFALMGKSVTSVDISQKLLDAASASADELCIADHIRFQKDDIMALPHIEDHSFDLVLTTNGTIQFISDLKRMFGSIHRILRTDSTYMLFDTHPYMYPFAGRLSELVVLKPYDSIGPFTQVCTFHWRIMDLINAAAEAGLDVTHMEEIRDRTGFFWHTIMPDRSVDMDWHSNPLAALPQWLLVKAVKKEQ